MQQDWRWRICWRALRHGLVLPKNIFSGMPSFGLASAIIAASRRFRTEWIRRNGAARNLHATRSFACASPHLKEWIPFRGAGVRRFADGLRKS